MIPTGKLGLIRKGHFAGWYILVKDDYENTGGYLILQMRDPDPRCQEGYDDWVENEEQLRGIFLDRGWEVDWDAD